MKITTKQLRNLITEVTSIDQVVDIDFEQTGGYGPRRLQGIIVGKNTDGTLRVKLTKFANRENGKTVFYDLSPAHRRSVKAWLPGEGLKGQGQKRAGNYYLVS